MEQVWPIQALDPVLTTWHISVGTYGARLHGGDRPTVDRAHNQRGEDFIGANHEREEDERFRMRGRTVLLPTEVRAFIEATIPAICVRGKWKLRICAAPAEEDHMHTLVDAERSIHGKQIRKWLKYWLTEALNERFGKPASGVWWAECGSTKPVKDESYLNNVFPYIGKQRTTPWSG